VSLFLAITATSTLGCVLVLGTRRRKQELELLTSVKKKRSVAEAEKANSRVMVAFKMLKYSSVNDFSATTTTEKKKKAIERSVIKPDFLMFEDDSL
jgi:hypothetical protein